MAVEDYHGLWELLWGLRPLLTKETGADIKNYAEKAVRELLSKGWIALFRRVGATGKEIPLQPYEIEDALADPINWVEPAPEAAEILVVATEQGTSMYYSLGNKGLLEA